VQETLVNGLDRSSTFQVTPFQPRMSEPTAVQLVARGHDTLSRVLPRPILGDGSTRHAVPGAGVDQREPQPEALLQLAGGGQLGAELSRPTGRAPRRASQADT
jgi:hypothetical protein